MYVGAESSVKSLSGIEGDLRTYVRTGEGANQVWPAHHYRHVVDWNGEAARWAPCPLERRYWMGFIRPQLELVARVLNETGTDGGGALELETYCFYSIYPGMASQKKSFCYCDYCFGQFTDSHEESPPADLPAGKRFDGLTKRGLLPNYERFLEDRLTALIREMMVKVRKIKPDLLFGFYPYAPFWYYDGLIRGGGTPELPCLVFPSAEYDGGYTREVSSSFFGDAPTPDGVAHIKRRGLPAMYAGGLWAKAMNSPEAIATSMDRLLRGADGYWVYDRVPDRFWEYTKKMNRWSTAHPGPLDEGDIALDALEGAVSQLDLEPQEGLVVKKGRIVALSQGEGEEVSLFGQGADTEGGFRKNWRGRGALPELDRSVFHSMKPSIRFEPSSLNEGAVSPFIDRTIPVEQAVRGERYELTFWVKGCGDEPMHFWVGQAGSNQYPAYMYYQNFSIQPGKEWQRLRVGVRYKGEPPLTLRFWTPPMNGTLWLDDIEFKPVRERTIHVPLTPPPEALGWGAVEWELSPDDARIEAEIVDAQDGHPLRTRLYSGDNLAPLDAVVGLKPVVLRIQVSPLANGPVALERVRIGFRSRMR